MMCIHTPGGNIAWANTRLVVVGDVWYSDFQRNFGAGVENGAECPGCRRHLPTALMHLDHIYCQASWTPRFVADGPVELITPLGRGIPQRSTEFEGKFVGNQLLIYKLGHEHKAYNAPRAAKRPRIAVPHTVVDPAIAWKNDIANLQWLCMGCNSSKQDQEDFAIWAARTNRPGRVPRPLSGKIPRYAGGFPQGAMYRPARRNSL